MPNFRPLYDRVLVKRLDEATTSAGGLFIPESAKEKGHQAQVIAVGPGRRKKGSDDLVPLNVKPGDRVLLSKWAGDEIKLEGEEHLILKESDILAVVEL